MKYYKYIDLDWKPARDKILEVLKEEPTLFSHAKVHTVGSWVDLTEKFYHIPEIHNMFRPFNLDISIIAFYVSYHNSSIHIDSAPDYISRIIFPILNCDNTETKFFEKLEEPVKLTQPNGEIFYRLDPLKCKHVDSFFLTQPVAFRVLEPHQVCIYHLNRPRISCIIEFQQDINYLIDE
jgi:hypothetical protein